MCQVPHNGICTLAACMLVAGAAVVTAVVTAVDASVVVRVCTASGTTRNGWQPFLHS